MALYTYQENTSPRDRFEKITILLDSGQSMTLAKGGTYDLTRNEYQRASQQVVLVPGSGTPTSSQTTVVLGIIGNLSNGDVPVWSSSLGAFVPGSGGGSLLTEAGANPPDATSDGQIWTQVQ